MYAKNHLIFLVDDDPFVLKMLENFIGEKFPSFTLQSYSSGEECLNDLSLKPALIILDYLLNGVNPDAINGLQVLKKIRERDSRIPVIFLSGQDNPEVSANTIKSGAYDYILKGEHSVHKLEIVMGNAIGKFQLEKKLSTQKVFNFILLALFIAVVVGVVVGKMA